ncbi:uncharacterized protein LOC132630745 [Lycium barbarum]|uniref:uncharacterized protein LOC132630745 n=1 Tax=Lycium barbarum TaxID=112863 RepID=UPI00293E88E8|nr:uncharacterized protein LOC132630745 [Lycium barbarum]
MESLTGLSLKGVCLDKVLEKHRGLSLYSTDVVGLSKKSQICFLGFSNSKIIHINSFSVHHKIIQPISCTSDSQIDTQSEETETTDTNQRELVRVKFQLNKECSFGQHFHIVGDDPMLGSWDPSNAVPLEWSEGHVWNVELDIPSGKTISYKFIMKVDDETIVWQEGPDRILQTWETKNTITVTEDWDNAELQTIVEEEPGVSPETLIAENLVPPAVVNLEDDANEEKTNDVLAIVTENITEVKEDVNTDLNEDTTMEAKAIGKNGMAFNDQVLSSKNESILVEDEKVPVLVPGLTKVLTSEVQTDKVVAESSLGSYSEGLNVVLNEAHMDKIVVAEDSVGSKSEEFNVTELSSKEEAATDLTHPIETPEMMMLNMKQEVTRGNEDIEKSELVEGRGEWSNGKPMEENVFESDIQWGKKTLQKFFAGLGFFVKLEG